jgi:hypothetical protein
LLKGNHPRAKQFDAGAAIHSPFENLQSIDLARVCFTFGASQLAGLCTGSIYRIKQDEKISMGARAKSSGQHGRAKRGRLGHYG